MDDLPQNFDCAHSLVPGIANNMVRHLGIDIVSRRVPPGNRLPTEIESAELLGISCTSYREAMRVRSENGQTSSLQKMGTTVSLNAACNHLDPNVIAWAANLKSTEAYIDALFQFHMSVEPIAAALAATRREPEDLFVLRKCVAAFPGDGIPYALRTIHEAIFRRPETLYSARSANRSQPRLMLQAHWKPAATRSAISRSTTILGFLTQLITMTPKPRVRPHLSTWSMPEKTRGDSCLSNSPLLRVVKPIATIF